MIDVTQKPYIAKLPQPVIDMFQQVVDDPAFIHFAEVANFDLNDETNISRVLSNLATQLRVNYLKTKDIYRLNVVGLKLKVEIEK